MMSSDLINAIAVRFPSLVAKDTKVAVKAILDAIGDTLAEGVASKFAVSAVSP